MGWLEVFGKHEKQEAENKAPLVLALDRGACPVIDKLHSILTEMHSTFKKVDETSYLVELCKQKLPAAVFIDASDDNVLNDLPLVNEIKACDTTIQILVCMQNTGSAFVIEWFRAGVDDIFLPPFNSDDLKSRLRVLLKNYNLRKPKNLEGSESPDILKNMFKQSPAALFAYDKNGSIMYWNDAAARITGFTEEKVIGKHVKEVLQFEEELINLNEGGRDVRPVSDVVGQILTADEHIRYIRRNARPVRDRNAQIIGVIESFDDNTENLHNQRLLEKRYLQLQIINDIGKHIATSVDLQKLIKRIGQKLVSSFFESSQIAVFLTDSESNRLILIATSGQHDNEVKKHYQENDPFEIEDSFITRAYLQKKRCIVESLDGSAYKNTGILPGSKSAYAFPVMSQTQTTGVLSIENKEQMSLDESDIYMLEVIAEYLGISIERIRLQERIARQNELLEEKARDLRKALHQLESQKKIIEQQKDIMEKELQKAGEFQRSLLPEYWPSLQGIAFEAAYIPSIQLGGDFYDVFHLNENLIGILAADASGHGAAAAMLSAMFKMSVRKYAAEHPHPNEVIAHVNRDFCQVLQMGEFFTAFYALYDAEKHLIYYSNAAHPKPLIYNYDSRKIVELDTEGFIIGAFEENIVYESRSFNMKGKNRLLIYTDGVSETANPKGELFGTNRVKEQLQNHINDKLSVAMESWKTVLWKFRGKESFDDDVTILMIDFKTDRSES